MQKPAEYPAGFHLEEGMHNHLNFLALIVVIVIIKVKIIFKNVSATRECPLPAKLECPLLGTTQ